MARDVPLAQAVQGDGRREERPGQPPGPADGAIGLALHGFHDANQRFPAGYLSTSTGAGVNPGTLDGPPGWGWAAQLLPYLEQDSLYRQLRLDLPAWDAANAAAVKTSPKVFINPGAPNQGTTIQVKTRTGTVLAE